MATLATTPPIQASGDERFFVRSAIAMAAIIVIGFSFQLAMGRSTFNSPPLVHAHAVTFMGWVVIYTLQNILVGSGNIALHRRLGWIGAVWIFGMLILGCMVTLSMVRRGGVPFFFQPQHFLIFDPLTLVGFVVLVLAAIRLRRNTDWHRRLHFCGMSLLLGPAFGRLLPMPLLVPWAYEATFLTVMIFPAIGIWADIRRSGTIHPAWKWGVAVMVGSFVVTQAITYSAAGSAIYGLVASGSPGADIDPMAFPAPPEGPTMTENAPAN